MKIKNTSNGSAIMLLNNGNLLIPPNEVVEVDDKSIVKKRWQTISLHPVLVKLNEDEKAVAKWKQSLEEAQEKSQMKPDETEDTEVVIVGSGNTLDMGNAPTVEDLEKKLKSLRASWKRTTRVRTKASIAQEIKEVEKQLEKANK